MIPTWLHILSIIALLAGLVCAVIIVADEIHEPQSMWIMNLVWPVVALFGTGLTLLGYFRYGRLSTRRKMMDAERKGMDSPGKAGTPFAIMVAKGASHCGAGCTIGDILAEWLTVLVPGIAVAFGWHWLFPDKIFAVWIVDFIFAFVIGVAFQYFTIAPMRGLGIRDGIIAAVKADAASLTAWQVGMYGFMAIAHFWIFAGLLETSLEVASAEFWFMMQIAMLCGFATAYPVNWWLIKAGLKEKM